MATFEKALVLMLERFAASPSGLFWIQFCMLIVITFVAVAVLSGIVWDRVKAAQHRRTQEAAEDFNTALTAKDKAKDSLELQVAELQQRMNVMDAEHKAEMAKMQETHKREMTGLRTSLEGKMEELRKRLEDYECVVAPGCPNRKQRLAANAATI